MARTRFAPKTLIPETQREWRKRKRQEWRVVMKAATTFLHGAAYTPADTKLPIFYPDMLRAMEEIKKNLSAKEWGR